MHKVCWLIIAVFCFLSCQNQKIPVAYLKSEFIIDQLDDSSYLSDVRSIFLEGYLYVTDYDRDQIIILTPEGSLIKYLGAKGKGPGEFTGASNIFIHSDTLWVYNDGKRSFEVFNFSGHLQTVRLPDNLDYPSNYKFFFNENRLFLASVSSGHSICSFDVSTFSVKQFGDLVKFDTDKHTRIRNFRHLFGTDDYLLAVSDNMPVIEIYDYSGAKLEMFNYSEVSLVRKRLEVFRRENEDPNGYGLLVQDASFEDGKLFLLLYTNKGNRISCNDVLVIDLSEKHMDIKQLLNLGESWYQSICASNGYLYAFGKDGLERFVLQ